MPAHLSEERIADARCSDGSAVTVDMWCANQMADLLAKDAAESVRHNLQTREWLTDRQKQLRELAVFVGKLTHEANNFKCGDGAILRDSEASKNFSGVQRRRARRSSLTPLLPSSHASQNLQCVRPVSNSLECATSGHSTGSRAPVRSKQRAGHGRWEAEARREEAFQNWWRENLSHRLSSNSVEGPSGSERLEALRAQVLAGMSSSSG